MAKKHVYSKDSTGFGDFVYVDLLPDVRRARQFNMNVILLLLLTIVLIFVFIYIPYSSATFDYEDLNAINNDYLHELALTQEEFDGNEIDLSAITFEDDIDELNKLRIDFNNLADDITLKIDLNNGIVRSITYSAISNEFEVEVAIVSQFSYNTINNQLVNLPWVEYSDYSTPERYGDEVFFTAIFVIGVDYNVE